MNPIKSTVFINNDVYGRPRAVYRPDTANRTRVIYAIYQEGMKRPLNVGKTGPALRKRISSYICAINKFNAGLPVGKLRALLIERMAKNVGKIYFKIVAQAGSDESLSEVEAKMIASLKPLYNHNKGGGGGSSSLSPSFKRLPFAPRHHGSPITPAKVYRFKLINRKVKAMFSPVGKKTQNVIYRIKNESTGERYIGQTSTTLAKRTSSHTSQANADEKFVAKSTMHKQLQAHPERFTVGIVRAVKPGFNLDPLEDDVIEHAKRIGKVFNKRRGGGGSKGIPKRLEFNQASPPQQKQ